MQNPKPNKQEDSSKREYIKGDIYFSGKKIVPHTTSSLQDQQEITNKNSNTSSFFSDFQDQQQKNGETQPTKNDSKVLCYNHSDQLQSQLTHKSLSAEQTNQSLYHHSSRNNLKDKEGKYQANKHDFRDTFVDWYMITLCRINQLTMPQRYASIKVYAPAAFKILIQKLNVFHQKHFQQIKVKLTPNSQEFLTEKFLSSLIFVSDDQKLYSYLSFDYEYLKNPQTLYQLLIRLLEFSSQKDYSWINLTTTSEYSLEQLLKLSNSRKELAMQLAYFLKNNIFQRAIKGTKVEIKRAKKKEYLKFWNGLKIQLKRDILMLGAKDYIGLIDQLHKKNLPFQSQQLQEEIKKLLQLPASQFYNSIITVKLQKLNLIHSYYSEIYYRLSQKASYDHSLGNKQFEDGSKKSKNEDSQNNLKNRQKEPNQTQQMKQKNKKKRTKKEDRNAHLQPQNKISPYSEHNAIKIVKQQQLAPKPQKKQQYKEKQVFKDSPQAKKYNEHSCHNSGTRLKTRHAKRNRSVSDESNETAETEITANVGSQMIKKGKLNGLKKMEGRIQMLEGKRFQKKQKPSSNLVSKFFNQHLHTYINKISQQSNNLIQRRIITFKRLNYLLGLNGLSCTLYGSCANGIANPNSDIDMVVNCNPKIQQMYFNKSDGSQKSVMNKVLDYVHHILQKEEWIKQINKISSAAIPVIKLKVNTGIPIRDPNLHPFNIWTFYQLNQEHFAGQVEVDISVDCFTRVTQPQSQVHLGILSTQAISQWLRQYQELYPLIMLFKTLLQISQLNTTYKEGINTYALIIMIVAFLKQKKSSALYESGNIAKEMSIYYSNFNQKSIGIDIRQDQPYYEKKFCTYSNEEQYSHADLQICDPLNNGKIMTRKCYKFDSIKKIFRRVNQCWTMLQQSIGEVSQHERLANQSKGAYSRQEEIEEEWIKSTGEQVLAKKVLQKHGNIFQIAFRS